MAFHHAMVTLAANDISSIPADEPGWSQAYSKGVALWIAENYVSPKYRGEALVLEGFENKHIFDESSLRHSGVVAGFAAVHVIPFGEDKEAWSALTVYASHLDLP
jgi:hypothetical protein